MCGHITMRIWSHFYWWSFTLPDIASQNMPMMTIQIVSDTSVKSSANRFLIEKHNYTNFHSGQKHAWTQHNEDMESPFLVVFHSA